MQLFQDQWCYFGWMGNGCSWNENVRLDGSREVWAVHVKQKIERITEDGCVGKPKPPWDGTDMLSHEDEIDIKKLMNVMVSGVKEKERPGMGCLDGVHREINLEEANLEFLMISMWITFPPYWTGHWWLVQNPSLVLNRKEKKHCIANG